MNGEGWHCFEPLRWVSPSEVFHSEFCPWKVTKGHKRTIIFQGGRLNFQELFLNKCLETKITAKKTTSPVNQGIFLGRTWKWKPKERYVDSLKWHHDLQVVYQMWFFRLHRNTGDLRVIFPKNLSFLGVKTHQVDWHTLKGFFGTYCWWTKSCTTKDDDYPIIYRVLYIPGGAGFLNHQKYIPAKRSMWKTPSHRRFVSDDFSGKLLLSGWFSAFRFRCRWCFLMGRKHPQRFSSPKRGKKIVQSIPFLGWWFETFLGIFIPDPWGNDPKLTSIFFKWVETTN